MAKMSQIPWGPPPMMPCTHRHTLYVVCVQMYYTCIIYPASKTWRFLKRSKSCNHVATQTERWRVEKRNGPLTMTSSPPATLGCVTTVPTREVCFLLCTFFSLHSYNQNILPTLCPIWENTSCVFSCLCHSPNYFPKLHSFSCRQEHIA